jgi:hypothetical protein
VVEDNQKVAESYGGESVAALMVFSELRSTHLVAPQVIWEGFGREHDSHVAGP